MLASLSLPLAVWIGLIMTPLTVAGGQILFKMASGRMEGSGLSSFTSLILDPVFIIAVAIYASATFLWVFVLRAVPLSIAYPFMSLSFVLVPLLAALFLGEALSMRYFFGAVLIIGGLIVVNAG